MVRVPPLPVRFVLLATLLWATLVPAWAAPSADPPYIGVWIDSSASVSDETAQQVVDEIARRNPKPQHVVVLIHGLATTRKESDAQYTRAARDLRTQFEKQGESAVVVGLQWDSAVPKAWIGQVMVGILGFGPKDHPYNQKVELARKTGRMGARQVLLRIQERFPEACLSVMAHSLGCELAHRTVDPEFKDKKATRIPESFRPDKDLNVSLLALCGADLDYDVGFRMAGQGGRGGTLGLVWLTVAILDTVRPTDLVLDARMIVRGTEALGNQFPRLAERQIEALCRQCRLVIDSMNIPSTHAFLKYYTPERLARLAAAAKSLREKQPHDLLKRLSAVASAPASLDKLTPFLDDLDTSVQYYVVWRLEELFCGGPRHLSDGSIYALAGIVGSHPELVERERAKHPCAVVRNGLWPTPRLLQWVTDQLPGRKAPSVTGGFDGP